MNSQINRLHQIAAKPKRLIIGLMSGTSLDGLDLALCELESHGLQTKLQLKAFHTLGYSDELRSAILQIFARPQISHELLCGLNAKIARVHAEMVLKSLKSWDIAPSEVDLIASHGQTVYHAPLSLTKNPHLPNSTLQIGDGDHLAHLTGIITLSDFRQKHIAAAGEGAPLALYGDYLLFSSPKEHRILLNIGGISNFSFIPKVGSTAQAFATDLGPGNTMMNQYMQKHFNLEMDKDAQLAKQGKVNPALLDALLQETFLSLPFPKTTGPELFNEKYLRGLLDKLALHSLAAKDIMATLARYTSEAIIRGISAIEDLAGQEDYKVYVSGGGLHNPLVMEGLRAGLPENSLYSFDVLGLNPDAKEACLFALLANQSLAGDPTVFKPLNNAPAVSMGKISLPY